MNFLRIGHELLVVVQRQLARLLETSQTIPSECVGNLFTLAADPSSHTRDKSIDGRVPRCGPGRP
jgi:hypothetical protein